MSTDPIDDIRLLVQGQWSALTSRMGLTDHDGLLWQTINKAYGEQHRHYHALSHVAHLIADFERVCGGFDDPDTALLALIFHDIVYDPARRDNEEKSGDLLCERLSGEISESRLERACRHIVSTRTHVATDDADTNLVLDLDMAILGAAWPDYLGYARGVWREYQPVYGEEAYRTGRIGLFLEPTLGRERIFLTDVFSKFEASARENLRRELTAWQTGGAEVLLD